MSRFFRLFLIPILISLIAGCVPGPAKSISQQAIYSKKPRLDDAQAAEPDRRQLAADNNAFAFDLYHRLAAGKDGLFYSPYSISLALAMAYAGAREDTAKQMAEAMHFTLPAGRLHPAFNAIDQQLATRKNSGGQGSDGKGFRLNIVNDIWGQDGYFFQPDFLDQLAMYYGSGLRQLDFINNPEAARKTINDYIAQKTEQRIQDLLPQEVINPLTRLVLTNAIFFNAAWEYPFEKELTKPAPFTRLDGTKINVPMMSLPLSFDLSYAAGDGYQTVALPYENTNLSMLLLVPDQGRFAEFDAGLDAARLQSILVKMETVSTHVTMPSFKLASEFSLSKELSEMGMVDAFVPEKANLSGMDGTRNLFIREVVHKSFIKVDEAGTEAAAATAVIAQAVSMPPRSAALVVDRPFIYLIRDEPTNTILFMGKVLEPMN